MTDVLHPFNGFNIQTKSKLVPAWPTYAGRPFDLVCLYFCSIAVTVGSRGRGTICGVYKPMINHPRKYINQQYRPMINHLKTMSTNDIDQSDHDLAKHIKSITERYANAACT
jgi:hypothetical protein